MIDIILILIVTVLAFLLFTFSVAIGPCLSDKYNANLTLSVIYIALYDRETYKWYKIAKREHKNIKLYTTTPDKVPDKVPDKLYLAPLDDNIALYYSDMVVISTVYPRIIEELISKTFKYYGD